MVNFINLKNIEFFMGTKAVCDCETGEGQRCGEELEYKLTEEWKRGGGCTYFSCQEHVIPNLMLERPNHATIKKVDVFYLKSKSFEPVFSSSGGRKLKKNLSKLEKILTQHAFEDLRRSVE